MAFNYDIPEMVGVRSADILNFLSIINEKKLEFHSFMLVKSGKIISQCWWEPYGSIYRHQMFSLSKSFTSTALGMLFDEGKLKVDELVADIFAEEIKQLGEHTDEKIKRMTVKNLLTMGTGMTYENWEWDSGSISNNILGFLSSHIKNEPGSQFYYHTLATYMQSAIVTRKTGQKLIDYLMPRLFEPLGIDPVWEEDKLGISMGGFGLNIKTEDIAKLGQLYLQKGVWEGKRLISEEWIEQATSKQISNGDDAGSDWAQGYGYQFWRCKPQNVYRGDGAFGQFCIVMPDEDAVIAITSNCDMQQTLNLIWDNLLPALKGGAPIPVSSDLEALRKAEISLTHLAPATDIEKLPVIRGEYMYSGEKDFPGIVRKIYIETQNIERFDDELILAIYRDAGADSIPSSYRAVNGSWTDNTSLNLFNGNPRLKLFRNKMLLAYKDKTANFTAWYFESPMKINFRFAFSDDFKKFTLSADGMDETFEFIKK